MSGHDPLLPVLAQLTDRDRHLLELLHDHKVLTTEQIATALFPNLDTAQHRLVRLYRLGVTERFRWLREGGGSYSWRYTIGPLGAAYVAALRGLDPPRRGNLIARRQRLATSPTLHHTIGANQFGVDLLSHARTHPGTKLVRWWSAQQTCAPWAFGFEVRARLFPDGHGIWTERDHTVGWFLEYDTGTEPLPRLVEKLASYREFVYSRGPAFPVLFWLHSAAREHRLHQRLGTERLAVPVATAARDHTGPTHPAQAVWTLHGDSGHRRRLADLPGQLTPEQLHDVVKPRVRKRREE
jgi:hypothetical protein